MLRILKRLSKDDFFLQGISYIENGLSKILSLAMIVVIFVSVVDLAIVLAKEVLTPPDGFLGQTLIKIFGLFLNVLIALEILENITAYLRKHVVQVELVVVTSITAVARKIIILDYAKTTGLQLIGLAIAIFALAVSYWIVRRANDNPSG
ncbi:MAG: phosphate-starvation-inducible PsiE family protein, partial [Thermosynechococcaceae cyanobacterium]